MGANSSCSHRFSPIAGRGGRKKEVCAGSESPIFLATAVQPDEVVFLEVELLMGGGKRWHCFLIWNPRHKAMAAMRQVTSCFH